MEPSLIFLKAIVLKPHLVIELVSAIAQFTPAVLSWSRFLTVSSSAKCPKSVLDRAGSGE